MVRDIVSFLMDVAERVGLMTWRAHSTPGGGWGITGKRAGRVFCRFDPKASGAARLRGYPGASVSELMRAGRIHRRKNAGPWVDIADMRGAQVLEPLFLRAYAEAGGA